MTFVESIVHHQDNWLDNVSILQAALMLTPHVISAIESEIFPPERRGQIRRLFQLKWSTCVNKLREVNGRKKRALFNLQADTDESSGGADESDSD
jgi:hypothetical protein